MNFSPNILITIPFFIIFSLATKASELTENDKIKGISFVAADQQIYAHDVDPIVEVNANWVTLMPYGFIGKDGTIAFNTKWQWWGEKNDGSRETVALCHQANLKIMIKPQIWMMNAYTGDFNLNSEQAWSNFEKSYKHFMLSFLEVAIDLRVEMFCIGTEWREFIKARPKFWNDLIKTIKTTYKGKLTYAANWDDYEAVPFWDQLDYIGINGYFPISVSKNPRLDELVKGWEFHKKTIQAFSKKTNKKILFTEIGYRSMEGSTIKPWEHNNSDKYSSEIQKNAYDALFQVLWNEDWFAGLFIWKWYHNHKSNGGIGNIDFTPQNKPAVHIIKSYWQAN